MCVCMPFAIILDGDRIICFHMLSHHAFSLAFDPVARAVNCFFAKPQRGPGTISWTLTWVDYSFDKLIAKNPLLNDSQGRQTEVERQALKKSLKDLDFIVPPPSWQLRNHHLLRDFLSFSISNLHQEVAVTSSCKTRNTANFTLQLTPSPLATHYKTQRLVQGRSKVAQLRSAFICAQMLRILRRSLFLSFEDFFGPWRFDLFYISPVTTFYSRSQKYVLQHKMPFCISNSSWVLYVF